MPICIDVEKIRKNAETYYREGDYYCSEAIVKSIKDEFRLEFPDSVISLASGFPVGMGGSSRLRTCPRKVRAGLPPRSRALIVQPRR